MWTDCFANASPVNPLPRPLRPLAHRAAALRLAAGRLRQLADGAQGRRRMAGASRGSRSEEHTSELQSLMRISYAVFCLKKKSIHTLCAQLFQRHKRIARIITKTTS